MAKQNYDIHWQGLEVVEDGLKKGFGSLGADFILKLGD